MIRWEVDKLEKLAMSLKMWRLRYSHASEIDVEFIICSIITAYCGSMILLTYKRDQIWDD